jgi:hypothetical protein
VRVFVGQLERLEVGLIRLRLLSVSLHNRATQADSVLSRASHKLLAHQPAPHIQSCEWWR